MVEIIEPHGGKVFDPACGSGGMFVQSAQFIEQHRKDAAADLDVYVYGTEKTLETVKLAKMNLAVNGLRGEVKQANTYSEDPFGSLWRLRLRACQPALQRRRRAARPGGIRPALQHLRCATQ